MRCHRIQPYLRNVVPNVYAAPINTLAKQLKGFGRQVGFAICGAPRSNLQITVRRTHATQKCSLYRNNSSHRMGARMIA